MHRRHQTGYLSVISKLKGLPELRVIECFLVAFGISVVYYLLLVVPGGEGAAPEGREEIVVSIVLAAVVVILIVAGDAHFVLLVVTFLFTLGIGHHEIGEVARLTHDVCGIDVVVLSVYGDVRPSASSHQSQHSIIFRYSRTAS